MASKVRLMGREYTCEGYQWSGPDLETVELLEAMTIDPDGTSPSMASPDNHAALLAASELGAEVLELEELEEPDPERVY